jgi:hypothetical protein
MRKMFSMCPLLITPPCGTELWCWQPMLCIMQGCSPCIISLLPLPQEGSCHLILGSCQGAPPQDGSKRICISVYANQNYPQPTGKNKWEHTCILIKSKPINCGTKPCLCCCRFTALICLIGPNPRAALFTLGSPLLQEEKFKLAYPTTFDGVISPYTEWGDLVWHFGPSPRPDSAHTKPSISPSSQPNRRTYTKSLFHWSHCHLLQITLCMMHARFIQIPDLLG